MTLTYELRAKQKRAKRLFQKLTKYTSNMPEAHSPSSSVLLAVTSERRPPTSSL